MRRRLADLPPHVVITTTLPAPIDAALRAHYRVEHAALRTMAAAEFALSAMGAQAIVVAPGDRVDRALIGLLPQSVQLIASYSTGLDHVDVAAAEARGIAVARTPDVLTDATADIALILMLMVLRGVRPAQRLIEEQRWSGWVPDQIFGHDIAGKTLGIVGPGAIGAATARRARAFGMNVIYWGRSRSAAVDALPAHYVSGWADFLELADVISLHLPLTESTHGLIDAAAIAQMRRGAVLINTARGGLIDEDAVIAALHDGQLGGAGLDVFTGEPLINPRWRSAPNTVLLPHIGSATHETRDAMGRCVLDALAHHLGDPQL
jgi:lactate dehydrogenase-like 2-hydroxyacid dehydrogenase